MESLLQKNTFYNQDHQHLPVLDETLERKFHRLAAAHVRHHQTLTLLKLLEILNHLLCFRRTQISA